MNKGKQPSIAKPAAAPPPRTEKAPEGDQMIRIDPNWSCAACKFYLGQACIAHPPVPVFINRYDDKGQPVYASVFPQMQPWGKCGDFEKMEMPNVQLT